MACIAPYLRVGGKEFLQSAVKLLAPGHDNFIDDAGRKATFIRQQPDEQRLLRASHFWLAVRLLYHQWPRVDSEYVPRLLRVILGFAQTVRLLRIYWPAPVSRYESYHDMKATNLL